MFNSAGASSAVPRTGWEVPSESGERLPSVRELGGGVVRRLLYERSVRTIFTGRFP